MMNLFASLLFAIALAVSLSTIFVTVLPARRRILTLLRDGPQVLPQVLPSVRLTSRRGVIRQQPATVPGYRAAA